MSGAAEVFVGKITKIKFAIARALPQKLGFYPLRHRLGKAQQLPRRWFLVTQEDIRRLDLGALADEESKAQEQANAQLAAPNSINRTKIFGIKTDGAEGLISCKRSHRR